MYKTPKNIKIKVNINQPRLSGAESFFLRMLKIIQKIAHINRTNEIIILTFQSSDLISTSSILLKNELTITNSYCSNNTIFFIFCQYFA